MLKRANLSLLGDQESSTSTHIPTVSTQNRFSPLANAPVPQPAPVIDKPSSPIPISALDICIHKGHPKGPPTDCEVLQPKIFHETQLRPSYGSNNHRR